MYFLTSIFLQGADGVLVPGGFGDRGVEGKIIAAKYARENRIPFLGICLGMQVAVLEFARSVLGVKDANSTEFDPNAKSPYVIFMPEVFILLLYHSNTKKVDLETHISFPCLWFICNVLYRDQKHIWEEPCVLALGGLIFRLRNANLQNCECYYFIDFFCIYIFVIMQREIWE